MATPRQPDLFAARGTPAPLPAAPPAAIPPDRPPFDPAALADADLIAALPGARQNDAAPLAREAARRALPEAIPALEALCRRFAGFGLNHDIAEQTAALEALSVLGAKDAVTRLIVAHAICGPGRRHAFRAAAALGCQLPMDLVAGALRDNDPAIRAAACPCARAHPAVFATLIDLLTDLHPAAAQSAALSLGLLGRREGVAILLRLLAEAPSSAVVESLLPIACEDEWVRLSQAALRHPDLAPPILAALDDLASPRAAKIAASLRHRLGLRD